MMSDKLRAAAKAALDWLKDKRLDTWVYMEGSQFYSDRHKQAKALDAALAEPEQEPVAWTTMPEAEDWCFVSSSKDPTGKLEGKWFPLYAAPPRREWVGLTGDEIEDLNKDQTLWEIIRAAEAMLREKNNG